MSLIREAPGDHGRSCQQLLWICALSLLVSGTWSTEARADGERVVVLEFEGQRASAARGAVVGALQRRLDLVPLADFEAAAAEAGVSSYTGPELSNACRTVGAVAVVTGEVLRDGGLVLRMTLRNCANGEDLDIYTVPFRGRRINTNALSTQLEDLVARLAAASAPTEEEPPPPTEPAPSDSEEQEPSDEEDEQPRSGDEPFLDGALVVSLATRSLELATRDPARITSVLYRGGMYSEVGLDAHFYPFRLFAEGFARNLGLHLALGRHLVASSKPLTDDDPATPEESVETSLLEVGADIFGLFPLGDGATAPRIGASVGWGMKEFMLGGNDYVASFTYKFFRVGAEAHYPLIPAAIPYLSLGYRFVNDVGDAGGFYGPDFSVGAFDATLGLHGVLGEGIFYVAALEYIAFSLAFGQPVGYAAPADTLPADTGSDTYFRGRVSVGYAFH